MIGLIDLDGLFYKSVYKSISFGEIRYQIENNGAKAARDWFKSEIVKRGEERIEAELVEIMSTINEMLDEPLESYELYVTTCRKSFRKSLSPEYKSKRERNRYVPTIRSHYLLFKDAVDDDELEADDLISLRAKELGVGNYIVVSTDKDLKQIGGHYWSYYREVGKTDEFGVKIAPFKQKEILFITEDEADYLFWTQMLTGDSTDGIQGIKGIGAAKAKKILDRDGANYLTVMREYISRGLKDEFLTNYQLLKLKEES